MKAEFTAIVKKDGDWWLGWVEEIPGTNAQERTKEELLVSLKEAAIDILELRIEESRTWLSFIFSSHCGFFQVAVARARLPSGCA